MPERIAIVGPESTGKTTLAETLSERTGGCLVGEVARDYIGRLNRPYHEADLLAIGKLQAEAEDFYNDKNCRYLFCDTTLLVIKIWSMHKYHRCHPWIEMELQRRKYDLYLLCNTDLPWISDPQREHPLIRQQLFDLYHKALIDLRVNYEIVTGQGEKRLENAMQFCSIKV